MSTDAIVAIITAAQQLIQVALQEKVLLSSSDEATVDAALASLRTTSDAMHAAAQNI